LFVFRRGGAADTAEMESVGLQKSTFAGIAFIWSCLVALMVGGMGLWASAHPVLMVAAVGVWALCVGLSIVLRQGGIILEKNSPEDKKRDELQPVRSSA
jgi:hypothetical protein